MLFGISWWVIVPAFFLVCTAICCILPMFAVDEEQLGIADDRLPSTEVVRSLSHITKVRRASLA
jgi:hypothetical protein